MGAMTELSAIFQEFFDAVNLAPIEVIGMLLVIIFFLILFLITFMSYFKLLLNIAAFAFPNARARAIGNPFIQSATISGILDAWNLRSLRDVMQKHGFPEGMEGEDPKRIERDLSVRFIEDCSLLALTAPEGIKPFFSAWSSRMEAEQLKFAIRAKKNGFDPEEIERSVIPVGTITPALIRKIAGAHDVEELALHLKNTPFGEPLSDAIQVHRGEEGTLFLETALDRIVFRQIHQSVYSLDTTLSAPFRVFIGSYSDIINLKTILRAVRDGTPEEKLQHLLLPAGTDLPAPKLKQLSEMKEISQVIAQIGELPYRPVIETAFHDYEEAQSLQPLEKALDEILLDLVRSLENTYALGPGPLLKFLIAREFELKNIRALSWGIFEGLPAVLVRPVLILEEVA